MSPTLIVIILIGNMVIGIAICAYVGYKSDAHKRFE
jgi:hypothetical protein